MNMDPDQLAKYNGTQWLHDCKKSIEKFNDVESEVIKSKAEWKMAKKTNKWMPEARLNAVESQLGALKVFLHMTSSIQHVMYHMCECLLRLRYYSGVETCSLGEARFC